MSTHNETRVADIVVRAGDNFQSAINAAQPGQTVELEAGATFVGNFKLPKHVDEEWIYIRSSRHQELPAEGTRVGPEHAHLMPRLISPDPNYNLPTLRTAFGAHHYRLIGIEFTSQASNISIVNLGEIHNATTIEDLPHHFVFDRVYVHGDSTLAHRRGITANGLYVSVVDSYISEIHHTGADTQAIEVWNGTGPFKIVNNHLEASGENIMFGGGDPSIENLVPSDIEIRGNHFFKPPSWKIGHPTYAGTPWSVKNLLELKNAQRVWIQGNVFENSWAHAQHGFALVLTPRNADGNAPWSTVEDVLIEDNIIRNASSGVSMLAQSGVSGRPSENLKRVTIRNNVFESTDTGIYTRTGWTFLIGGSQNTLPAEDIVIEHNTVVLLDWNGVFLGFGDSGTVVTNFRYQDNLTTFCRYGLHGTGSAVGMDTLERYAENYVFSHNGVILRDSTLNHIRSSFPADTRWAVGLDAAGFQDRVARDWRLSPSSPFKNRATDGTDIGADIDSITGNNRMITFKVELPTLPIDATQIDHGELIVTIAQGDPIVMTTSKTDSSVTDPRFVGGHTDQVTAEFRYVDGNANKSAVPATASVTLQDTFPPPDPGDITIRAIGEV